MYYHIRCMHVKYPLNRDNRFDKTVITKTYLNCINLQLAIRILKNHAFRTCTIPSRTFRPILRSIGLLDNELPRKKFISTDERRRDGQTDRRTDGQTSRTTTIGSFFEKKEKMCFKDKDKRILVRCFFYHKSIINC